MLTLDQFEDLAVHATIAGMAVGGIVGMLVVESMRAGLEPASLHEACGPAKSAIASLSESPAG